MRKGFISSMQKFSTVSLAYKAGGFAGGMLRKLRLRTTGRHFERANKGETGEGGRGEKGKKGGGGVGEWERPPPTSTPTSTPSTSLFPLPSFSLVRAFKMAG